jgi:H(+)-translocating pyrophosphatase
MSIAVKTNYRVAYQAAFCKDTKEKLYEAFNAAFRGGSVMGFCLVSISLSVLCALIILYKQILNPVDTETYTHMFEYLAGYGLGGSTVALFCRVGGGIFTKAADVGADLAGKVEADMPEDSPDNPAVIADNVGDNVGDIAGMGSDLFGSFAESTCAALVVSATSVELINGPEFLYPLVLSAAGIICCIFTAIFATNIMKVEREEDISRTLSYQLYISTLFLLPTIFVVSYYFLPETFTFVTGDAVPLVSGRYAVMACAMLGLVAGLIIGGFTDYYTSNEFSPVQDLAKSCIQGSAINIIQGLALGYLSTIIPICAISGKIFFTLNFYFKFFFLIIFLCLIFTLNFFSYYFHFF